MHRLGSFLFALLAAPGWAIGDPAAIENAWPNLDSPDPSLREAARKTIEAQPFTQWKERALEEKNLWASLEALRALAEACPPNQAATLSPHLCEQISTLRLEEMDFSQQLSALALTRLVFEKLGPLSQDEREQMIDLWSHFQTAADSPVSTAKRVLLDWLAQQPVRNP